MCEFNWNLTDNYDISFVFVFLPWDLYRYKSSWEGNCLNVYLWKRGTRLRRFEHPFWRYDGERTREEEMLVAYFEQRGVLKLVVLAYVLRATVIPLLKKKPEPTEAYTFFYSI